MEVDVAIAGAGPAGAATALALATHAPGLAVALCDGNGEVAPRVGETLPPAARPLLAHLGVLDAFRREGHLPVAGTVAAWGGGAGGAGGGRPRENHWVFSRRGEGWHLDRARFDAFLAAEAGRRGVHRVAGRVVRARPADPQSARAGGWRLELADGDGGGSALSARFVVDATGAAASLARRRGARFVPLDRLVGYVRFFDPPPGGVAAGSTAADPRTVVEAFADGWWYTAGLPCGRRVAACLTDADIARRLGLADATIWSRLLEATTGTVAAAVATQRPAGPVVVRTAGSRRLEPAAGEGWLAVGDAASVLDPLSSAGITKALRAGVYAAYAVADRLLREDLAAPARYRRFVATEFAAYAEHRARVYGEERRWPERAFWRRRAG